MLFWVIFALSSDRIVGRFSLDGTIGVDEVGDGVVAAFAGNLGDRLFTQDEHLLGTVDSLSVEMLFEAYARHLLECAGKIAVAETETCRKLALADVLGVVLADVEYCVVDELCNLGVMHSALDRTLAQYFE